MRAILSAAIIALSVSSAHGRTSVPSMSDVMSESGAVNASKGKVARHAKSPRKFRYVRHAGNRVVHHRPDRQLLRRSASIFVQSIDAKEQEIIAACGARRTPHGGYRRAAGYHGLNLARDVVGDYACIYAHLRDWPGGVSVDSGNVRHVHFDVRPSPCHFYHPGRGPRGCHYALPFVGPYLPNRYAKRHRGYRYAYFARHR